MVVFRAILGAQLLLALAACSSGEPAKTATNAGSAAVDGIAGSTGHDTSPAGTAGGVVAAAGSPAAMSTGGVAGSSDAGSEPEPVERDEDDAGADDAGTNATPDTPDFVEDHRAECTIPSMPAVSSLKAIATLPDPFTMMDGTAVTTKAQWTCRREEIGAMLEHYELGEKPRNPEKVTGALSGNTLTVTVTDKGKSIKFTVAITKPAGSGPFPAVIGYGHVNLGSALSGLGVATIDYTAADIFNASAPNQMAKDGSSYRGQGLFYDLYGSNHSAGALMAWAWGTSRIIDALVATPEAGIDPAHIAVTGCSRFGKGALVAGAFDQRIALTLPQEGGSGGCSAWRGIAFMKSQGNDIEQLSNVAGGSNWFRASFSSDFSDSTSNEIPYDHHELAGMVAPRALLDVEQDGIAWLGPGATYINNMATRELFNALGATESHTYSLSTGHEHCTLPMSQYHWVQSYVKKYLLGQAGEAAAIDTPSGYNFDHAKWIDWKTPALK